MKNLDEILAAAGPGDTITLDSAEIYETAGPWSSPNGINCQNGVTIHAGSAVIRLKLPAAGVIRPDKDLPILRGGENVTIFGGTWDCNYAGCPGWFTQGLRFHGKYTLRGLTIIGMSGSKTSGTPAGAVESFGISSIGDTGGSLVEDCIIRDCKVADSNDYVSGIFIGATVNTEVISTVADCSVDLGVHGQFAYSSNQPTDFLRCDGKASRFWYNDTGPTRRCRIIDCHGDGNYAVIDCVAFGTGVLREVTVIRGVFTGTRAVEWWDQSGGNIAGYVNSTEVDYSACQYHLASAGNHGSILFDRCLLGDSTAAFQSDQAIRPVIIDAPPPVVEPPTEPPPLVAPMPSTDVCSPTPTVPGSVVIKSCPVDPVCQGGGAGSQEWYSSCRNPMWAFDHQTECGELTLTEIQFDPPTLAIAKNRSGSVRVVARFGDGRTADVTGEAAITILDPHIARHVGSGLISGDELGTSGVTAFWRGMFASGQISVFDNSCAENMPWDVVLLVDDGGYYIVSSKAAYLSSIGTVVVPAFRRLYSPRGLGYENNVLAFQLGMDLLSNGVFDPSTGWNPYSPNPNRNDIGGIRAGKDRIWTGSSWSNAMTPNSIFPSSDVGGMLMAAAAAHAQGRADARKLVVLYTLGGETKCTPGIAAAAAAIKSNGIELAVVTGLKPSDPVYSMCNFPDTAWQVLQAAASSDCLFVDAVGGGGGLSNAFGSIARSACTDCASGVGIGLNLL